MRLIERITMPLGMIGVIIYLSHTIVGNILWPEYNPITTAISALTADGAPNASMLRLFTLAYGILVTLFVIGFNIKAFRRYHKAVRAGCVLLLIMQVVSLIGYNLFPLSENENAMNFQNIMHIIVTVIVVSATISSGFVLAYGYIKQEKMKKLGRFILVMAIIITISGIINPITIGLGLNILGLIERITIYSLQMMIFVISFYYVFIKKEYIYNEE